VEKMMANADTLVVREGSLGMAANQLPLTPETLLEMYGERIFRYCYKMLGNRTEAEDATAETFLRVLRNVKKIRADGAFRTWLYRIARNFCIDKMRQRKLSELPENTPTACPDDKVALKVTVHAALALLPKEYREAVTLRDLEQLPSREAAEVLEISEPALKSRLYRGRRVLRDLLGPSFGVTSTARKPRQSRARIDPTFTCVSRVAAA
jgi:RNA polymerase sigma-70 factor (ECF subfamily)